MDQIEGIILTPLPIIQVPKGNVMHGLKASDSSFVGFGEAYFSMVNQGEVKGWKKHSRMTLNLLVPAGEIRFVIYDDRPGSMSRERFQSVTLSNTNYCRLTVPPMVWMGFQGIGGGVNLLLNIASIEHDPKEALNADLEEFQFDWQI